MVWTPSIQLLVSASLNRREEIRILQFSAKPSWRSLTLHFAILLGGLCWLGETVRVALVETWGESSQLKDLERARALDPRNAEIYYRMGTLELLGATSPSSAPAWWFRHATDLNPKIGRYWLGLGRACFVAQDQACADQALERATRLSPMTPSTEWEAATYEVFTGHFERSFSRLAGLLRQDPDKEQEIFRFTWRAFDPEVTWQRILAGVPDNRVKCDYLVFLSQNGRFDLAKNYWMQMAAASAPPSFAAAKAYLQQLLATQRYVDAARVWSDLLHNGSLGQSGTADQDTLVFNGGFERPALNAGFDWNLAQTAFVSVDFLDPSAQSGKHALRIDYTVPHNVDTEPVYQLIPVLANQKYLLTAYSRSDELTSDSGPRLRVEDVECPACLDASSEMTLGTTPWHELKLTFSTGPKTEILRLSVWRARGRSFPMDISGSFWLDAVSLIPQQPSLSPQTGSRQIANSQMP